MLFVASRLFFTSINRLTYTRDSCSLSPPQRLGKDSVLGNSGKTPSGHSLTVGLAAVDSILLRPGSGCRNSNPYKAMGQQGFVRSYKAVLSAGINLHISTQQHATPLPVMCCIISSLSFTHPTFGNGHDIATKAISLLLLLTPCRLYPSS